MSKTTVALFGASGTMGFQAFRELWGRRDRYDLRILVLPSERTHGPLGAYEGRPGLTIVWGDATRFEDVAETVHGADWVLNAMAYISPMADYYPERAQAVNVDAIGHILRAIEAEPDGAQRIRYVHTGTVAETGNRPVGIHVGRVGDPLNPSVFDSYALTKIAGERLVLESSLRYWVSLRMTFIMPTSFRELQGLNDAIAFHMPFDARMENITDRDAGFGLANCLEVGDDSDFWRRVYNMGGGPAMRTIAVEFLRNNYRLNGLDPDACLDPSWYAQRNFHMQYYEDSAILNGYLHYWRDSVETHQRTIAADRPWPLKVVAALARRVPAFRRRVEKAAYAANLRLAEGHRNSPLFWKTHGNEPRIRAFFFPHGRPEPNLDPNAPWRRLDHGWDEAVAPTDVAALQQVATFRGGHCRSTTWAGDLSVPVEWECAMGHGFTARVFTVLGAGHWCPVCVATWNGDERARRNPFFAQVWYADHSPDENNSYPIDGIEDIRGADKEPL